MHRYSIKFGQFYITNVCNLTCGDCASFNNLPLKGHFLWAENQEVVEQWSKIVDIEEINILGGEPFLNRDLDNWVTGIRNNWPQCNNLKITTGINDDRLLQFKDSIRKWNRLNVGIEISIHDPSVWDQVDNYVTEILDINCQVFEGIFTETAFPEKFKTYMSNGVVLFALKQSWKFAPSAIKEIRDGVIIMHDNDSVTAHKSCLWSDCHYFVEGKFYKCVVAAAAPELAKQKTVDQHSHELIMKTEYATPTSENLDRYFSNLHKEIPQCSLCPVNVIDKIIPIFPLATKKQRV
jgi:uncharacterized Fe-S cluster-containing radical SAM superfamily protein